MTGTLLSLIIPAVLFATPDGGQVVSEGLHSTGCPDGLPAGSVTCGTLSVPENYAQPDGRHIELHVVIVPALEPRVGAVPQFDLAGRPAQAVTEAAHFYLVGTQSTAQLRRDRPVVLVDDVTAELMRRRYNREELAKTWGGNLLRAWWDARRMAAATGSASPSVPRPLDVQGHRGNRGNMPPGNTLASFESALALDVDTIEADMQITADGLVVMGHDDNLRKTGCSWAGEGGEPSSLVSELDAAIVAHWDCHPELEGIQAPPPLADALALIDVKDPEVALSLELKRTTKADADVYVAAILDYHATCGGCLSGRLVLQSFEWEALRHARARWGDELEFRAAILDKRGEFAAIAAARAYAEIWSPKHDLVTPDLVDRVHELGMIAVPWTVNDEARMRELIDMRIDGIITDYPDVLLALLDR